MIIYHLGFPASSYLAAKVFPRHKVIECHPLCDQFAGILEALEEQKDFLFHIDLSVQANIPRCRTQLLEALSAKGIRVHNEFHTDQRKRVLQQFTCDLGFESLSADKDGDPDENLLVKSDLNVGGGPERRTLIRFPGMPVPPLPTRVTTPFEYYRAKRRDIPNDIWSDETLHVERCIENSRGIVLRTFWNHGKAVVSVIENPHEVVKKRNEKCRRWNYTEPVDQLTATAFSKMRIYAERINVGFFAADFVVDGEDGIYLVDLNLTPQWVVSSAPQPNNMTPELPIYEIPQALRHQ